MGRRREGRQAGEVLQAVRGQENPADLLLHVRPELGQPLLSCTSLVDGLIGTWYQVSRDAAFVAIAKAPAHRINAWAKKRGWTQMALVSGYDLTYQADYKCQDESNDDMQWPVMHCFRKRGGKIYHFWGTELSGNHLDTVWPYWNIMDFTPEGRPEYDVPPQKFRSRFLEKHFQPGRI